MAPWQPASETGSNACSNKSVSFLPRPFSSTRKCCPLLFLCLFSTLHQCVFQSLHPVVWQKQTHTVIMQDEGVLELVSEDAVNGLRLPLCPPSVTESGLALTLLTHWMKWKWRCVNSGPGLWEEQQPASICLFLEFSLEPSCHPVRKPRQPEGSPHGGGEALGDVGKEKDSTTLAPLVSFQKIPPTALQPCDSHCLRNCPAFS